MILVLGPRQGLPVSACTTDTLGGASLQKVRYSDGLHSAQHEGGKSVLPPLQWALGSAGAEEVWAGCERHRVYVGVGPGYPLAHDSQGMGGHQRCLLDDVGVVRPAAGRLPAL